MWWLATTWRPFVTATVLFSSAPTASTAADVSNGRAQRLGGVSPRAAQQLHPPPRLGRPSRRSGCGSAGRGSGGRQPAARVGRPRRRPSWAIGSSLTVAARHHERAADTRQQQVVQRAVGQHQPELGQAGRHSIGDAAPDAPCGEDDRPPRAIELPSAPASSRSRKRAGGAEVGDHHRERLVVARLAPAQLGDGIDGRRIDRQVVAADALDRHDRTAEQRRDGRRRWRRRPCVSAVPAVSRHVTCGPHTGQALGWAWNRRSAGIVVLRLAAGAHGEPGHRRAPGGRTEPTARSCTAARSSCSW